MLTTKDAMPENTATPDSATRAAVIKVAVIEDIEDIREGLQILLNSAAGFCCTGSFGSIEDALRTLKATTPDLRPAVILTDLGLPGMSGLEGIALLKPLCSQGLVLVLTVYDDDERIFKALCAGACGYLLKKTPHPQLLEGIREAVNGGAPMTPEIARRVIELFQRFRPPARVEYHLTPHEARLLKLLAEGHSYRSAAAVLDVTPHGVSFHLRSIYEKLQVHSKSEAVAKALREHLIS
jgi:DNA-binding NarL/FixJ family response regulator